VLTTIEKTTAHALALLFNLRGPYAGGVTMPGGSASNTTALVIARNELFPKTKTEGYSGKRFVLFASAHGHYSLEKAAQVCGLGSSNAWLVPVDSQCRMIPSELERLIRKARAEGFSPFFVSASAGTTVIGSFDPFPEIAKICRREKLWFHIDASWGGPVVFSAKHRYKLRGSEFADSVTINPHKMMGVPLSCSFLLGADLRRFWRANTLPAGYLFHGNEEEEEEGDVYDAAGANGCSRATEFGVECWDLADLTLQCGRRGDALKLALGWMYYGTNGYGTQIDNAFDVAAYFASLVATNGDLELLSENPPPCLQVCFYFAPGCRASEDKEVNTRRTKQISRKLVEKGFMVDFAPGERGLFFRAVVHLVTTRATVEALITAVVDTGRSIISLDSKIE
jgi:glutamate decarboxylase